MCIRDSWHFHSLAHAPIYSFTLPSKQICFGLSSFVEVANLTFVLLVFIRQFVAHVHIVLSLLFLSLFLIKYVIPIFISSACFLSYVSVEVCRQCFSQNKSCPIMSLAASFYGFNILSSVLRDHFVTILFFFVFGILKLLFDIWLCDGESMGYQKNIQEGQREQPIEFSRTNLLNTAQ